MGDNTVVDTWVARAGVVVVVVVRLIGNSRDLVKAKRREKFEMRVLTNRIRETAGNCDDGDDEWRG